MMETAHCRYCDADMDPTANSICPECIAKTRANLDTIIELWPELRRVLGRRYRFGDTSHGTSTTDRLPIRTDALELVETIAATLWPWTLKSARHGTTPRDWTARSQVEFSASNLNHLATEPDAAKLVSDTTWLAGRVIALIDRPPDTIRVTCPNCGADNHAPAHAAIHTCRYCRELINLALIRAQDRRALQDFAFSVPELEDLTDISAATIRSWVHRGRLIPHDRLAGSARYLLADILTLAATRRDTRKHQSATHA